MLDELNVKGVSYVDEAEELASYEVKPNFRALGPRLRLAHAGGGGGDRRSSTRARPRPPSTAASAVTIEVDGQRGARSAPTTSRS